MAKINMGVTDNPDDIPEGAESVVMSEILSSKVFSANLGRLIVKYMAEHYSMDDIAEQLPDLAKVLNRDYPNQQAFQSEMDNFCEMPLRAMFNDSLTEFCKLMAFVLSGTIVHGDLIECAERESKERRNSTIH